MHTETQIETHNLTSLIDKTLFVILRFELFGNFRKADVELKTNAVESRFRKQKQLLDSPELKAINKANLRVKDEVYSKCLPGNEVDGMRLVPFANIEKVHTLMTNYEDVELPGLVDKFIAVYDDQRKQAEAELKEQFNPALYPTKEQMRAEFKASHRFKSFDVPAKLGEISASVFQQETEKAKAQIDFATESVITAMRATAHLAVQKLADGLSGETNAEGRPKKLYGSYITGLQDFLKDFDIMNSAGDKELAADMENLKSIMEGVDIDKIRESESFKLELTTKISEIATHLTKLAEPSTGRKFRS